MTHGTRLTRRFSNKDYFEILADAWEQFRQCGEVRYIPISAEPGSLFSLFHFRVGVREDLLKEQWRHAIDVLIEAIDQRDLAGRRRFTLLSLPSPGSVIFAERLGAVRLIVQYHPPTIDELGRDVPEMMEGRFDAAGVIEVGAVPAASRPI